jgi:hypothetical protein
LRHTFALAAVVLTGLAASPALAKDQPVPTQPAVFQAVISCKTIADPTERLACYDRSVGALSTAAEAKDVLVVDRETARKTKKGLFGLALPRIKLFGDNDDEEIEQIESTIASTYAAKDGSSVFVLPDGARWKQTDGRFTYPKAGQPIVIKRGSLGSFFARVNGQTGVRVVRLQTQ